MQDRQPPPDKHLQRLALACHAVELVPSEPEPPQAHLRTGRAGEVPLSLSARKNGVLEVRAESPFPLPEGLEALRNPQGEVQLQSLNPAAARRLSARDDVRTRLKALFEAAPEARVSQDAVHLEIAAEATEEQLRRALRAGLRAALVLGQASQELAQEAEHNRSLSLSHLTLAQKAGGRRFIKLLPEKPEASSRWRRLPLAPLVTAGILVMFWQSQTFASIVLDICLVAGIVTMVALIFNMKLIEDFFRYRP